MTMFGKSWQENLRSFIFPELNRKFFIRLAFVAGVSALLFLLFKPCVISGSSMEPSWYDGSVTVSFRWQYLFSPPEKGDVVTISFFGRKELLKRVVALPGDVVEFRNGKLFVNGKMTDEPYVVRACDWSMDPVKVREGYCFVVGDNRDQPIAEHLVGEVLQSRISGGVWF
jgi:signal peptidase I